MASETCLVLIPGFKGSRLTQTASGPPVWLTTREALVGRRSLAYDRGDLGVPNPLLLGDGGILDAVPVVPGLFASGVYAPTIAALRAALPGGWDLRPYHFDWRRDPENLVRNLDDFIGGIVAEGVHDVRVLAHSMGAMLTASWLLRPQTASGAAARVSRAAFVAGAFRGTAKMFRNLQTGDDPTGLNTTLLSADALGTFPSSYHLMAEGWPVVVDEDGAPATEDLRDVDLWEERRWGLFRDGNPAFAGARRAFLSEQFDRSRAFLRALNDPAARPPAGLSVRNLSGTSGGTLNQVILRRDGTLVLSEKARRKAPSLAAVPLEAPGDGTIAAHAAELPPALAAHAAAPTLAVPADHMAVVQRGAALDELVRFLVS